MAVSTYETNGRVIQPDPETEYIGGGQYLPLHGGYASLASHIKDVTEYGGAGLAELMMTDETVASAVHTIAQGILAQGMQITATVELDDSEEIDDLSQDDLDLAFRVEDHCQRCWKALPDAQGLLWRLAKGAMVYRTMLAEVVKDVAESGPDEGLYVLDRIPVKSPGTWAFDLDNFGNVRGIRANLAGPGLLFSASEILDRRHFVILPWDPVKGNPWGEGVLGRAYNAWNFKVQFYPMLWKYAELFAIPQEDASPGENAKPRRLVDDDGQEYGDPVSPEHWLFSALMKAKRGGSIRVTPFGTTTTIRTPPGNGAVFDLILDRLDRAINRAILQTSGPRQRDKRSGSSEESSKAEIQGLVVSYGKAALRQCLVQDLWRVHVEQNFGVEVARRFTPEVSFGMIDREDLSRIGGTMAKLWAAGMLTDAERVPVLNLILPGLRSRRKSSRRADLSRESGPGRRPVNVGRRDAA